MNSMIVFMFLFVGRLHSLRLPVRDSATMKDPLKASSSLLENLAAEATKSDIPDWHLTPNCYRLLGSRADGSFYNVRRGDWYMYLQPSVSSQENFNAAVHQSSTLVEYPVVSTEFTYMSQNRTTGQVFGSTVKYTQKSRFECFCGDGPLAPWPFSRPCAFPPITYERVDYLMRSAVDCDCELYSNYTGGVTKPEMNSDCPIQFCTLKPPEKVAGDLCDQANMACTHLALTLFDYDEYSNSFLGSNMNTDDSRSTTNDRVVVKGCSDYWLGLADTWPGAAQGGFTGFTSVKPYTSLRDTTVVLRDVWDKNLGCSEGSEGGIVFAVRDPLATNLRGVQFEILQLGTFSFLSVTESSSTQAVLSLDATIERAGELCGATYIRNVTLKGTWINEAVNLKEMGVRAVSPLPGHKKSPWKCIEVDFGEGWQDLDEFRRSYVTKLGHQGSSFIVKQASHGKLLLIIHGVKFIFDIDQHRIHSNGKLTNNFQSFLNVNLQDIKSALNPEGLEIAGLLAYDDHSGATQVPDGCKAKSTNHKSNNHKLIFKDARDLHELDQRETSSFLSYASMQM